MPRNNTGELYTDTGEDSIAISNGPERGHVSSDAGTSERGSGNPTGSATRNH
jgi:hypothetical protein